MIKVVQNITETVSSVVPAVTRVSHKLNMESNGIQVVPEKASVGDLESRDVDGFEPQLKAIGYHLKPDNLRPSVWEYAAGESSKQHRHETQEELYTPLSGKIRVEYEDEFVDLEPSDFLVVPPSKWRRVTALEDSTLLAIGAPNEAHDAVFPDDE